MVGYNHIDQSDLLANSLPSHETFFFWQLSVWLYDLLGWLGIHKGLLTHMAVFQVAT